MDWRAQSPHALSNRLLSHELSRCSKLGHAANTSSQPQAWGAHDEEYFANDAGAYRIGMAGRHDQFTQ